MGDQRRGGYVQSRRLNMIMKFVADKQVLTGSSDIVKYVVQQDHEDGRTATADRKTVKRLLDILIADRLLCVEQVSHARYAGSTYHTLYHLPSVDPEVLETARQTVLDMVEKFNKRKMKMEESRKKEEEQEEEDEEEEEDDDTADGGTWRELERELIAANIPGLKNRARYQRLKQLHFYLWVLAHGLGPKDCSTSGTQLVHQLPWLKNVEQLPQHPLGPGYLSNDSVIENMPLHLWLIVTGLFIGSSFPVFPSKYISYCCDPENGSKKLHEIPAKLRKYIGTMKLPLFMQQLQAMKLIDKKRIPERTERKYMVYLCLQDEAEVLDTSVCSERASFFTEEAREVFQSTTFHFESLSDLEEYWIHLQYVCLKTRIYMFKRKRKGSRGRSSSVTPRLDPSLDQWSLPLSSQVEERQMMDSLGFGAGGLPPLMLSHNKKNWHGGRVLQHGSAGSKQKNSTPSAMESPRKRKKRRQEDDNESTVTVQYGPGDELVAIPSEAITGELSIEERNAIDIHEAESLNGEKVGDSPEISRVKTAKRRKILVPKSLVQAHTGGRGYSRRRVAFEVDDDGEGSREDINTTRNPDKKVSSQAASEPPVLRSVFIDEGDEKKREKWRSERRIHWRAEQEKFLFCSYLTAVLLHRLVEGCPQVSFQLVTSCFRKHFPDFHWCTVYAVKSRLSYIKRFKVNPIAAVVSRYLVDLQKELEELGTAAPPLEFQPVFEFVFPRLSSFDCDFLTPVASLPSSMDEFHSKFHVVTPTDSKAVLTTTTVAMVARKSERVLLLSDLIMSVISQEFSGLERLAIFKLLERYPQDKLEEAWAYLREKGFIRSKRNTDFSLNPFVSTWLHPDFHGLLESIVSHKTLQEKQVFDKMHGVLRTDSAMNVELDDGAVRVEEEMIVCGTACAKGSVAAVLDSLALLDKHVLSASIDKPIDEEKSCANLFTSVLRQLFLVRKKDSLVGTSAITEDNSSIREDITENRERTPAFQEGTPASKDGTPTSKDGTPASTPVSKEGTLASKEGTPASKDGTPASKDGTPTSKDGSPAFRNGTPTSKEGTPASKVETPSSIVETTSSKGETPASKHGIPASKDSTPVQDQALVYADEAHKGSIITGGTTALIKEVTPSSEFGEGSPIISGGTPALVIEVTPSVEFRKEFHTSISQSETSSTEIMIDNSMDVDAPGLIETSTEQQEDGGMAEDDNNDEMMELGHEGLADKEELHIDSVFVSELDKCSLLLQPSINVAALLEPVPQQTPCASSDTSSSQLCGADSREHLVAQTFPPTSRNLASYLALCHKHLSYTQSECSYAGRLYELIEQAGAEGMQPDELLTASGDGNEVGHSFQEIVMSLVNFEMIYVVGTIKEVLISYKYAESWLCRPSDKEPWMISHSPWMMFSSCDPNEAMLSKYLHAVHTFILVNPGVTWDRLMDELAIILTPCRLQNILQVLECEGKIQQYSLECPSSLPSLFSKPDVHEKAKASCNTKMVKYFAPVVN